MTTELTPRTPAEASEAVERIEHFLMLLVRERIGTQWSSYDDALQEARIRAWQRLAEGHPQNIALHAAKQAIIDVLRGNRMTGSKSGKIVTEKHSTSIFKQGDEGEGYVYEPPSDQAEADFEAIENRELLGKALNALSDRDRDIVVATYIEELTQAEVAQRHGITRQAISLRLKKAMGIMQRSVVLA